MTTFENCEIFSNLYFSYARDYKATLSDGNYDYNKEKVETVFINCSDLLKFSENSSPKADAIVFPV